MKDFERLEKIRTERGFSVEDIAKVLDVSPMQVRKMENGSHRAKMHDYVKLARFYNLRIDYLAGLINEPLSLTEK